MPTPTPDPTVELQSPPAPPDPVTPPVADPAKGVPDPAPGTTWVYIGHVTD